MYLAGYAIECLIKAKLMKMFKQSDLEGLEAELKRRHIIPDDSSLFDHRIELYVGASGRLDALRSNRGLWRSRTDGFLRGDITPTSRIALMPRTFFPLWMRCSNG